MNVRTLFVVIGIICYIVAYAADCLMESSVIKGLILLFSSTMACFSFLKAMVYVKDDKTE